MKKIQSYFCLILFLYCFKGVQFESHAQARLETFGKNKIQYRDFDWKIIESEDFIVYYYDRSGRELARYVSEQAENDLLKIQRELGVLLQEPLHIFIYNHFRDYHQSNLGYKVEHQVAQFNSEEEIRLEANKLSVFYNGNYESFKTQLRKGFAKLYFNDIIFRGNPLTNKSDLNENDLPYWLSEGFIHFIVDEWTSKDESFLRNYLNGFAIDSSKYYQVFDALIWDNPEFVGKMFWKYMFEEQNIEKIHSFLEVANTKGNLYKASKEVLEIKLKKLFSEIVFKNIQRIENGNLYENDRSLLISIAKNHSNEEIRSLKVSPRGSDIAYTVWREGEYEVVIQKVDAKNPKEARSSILKGGRKNLTEQGDPDYPLIAWSNNGFKLGMVYEKNGRVHLRIYDAIKAQIQNYIIPKSRFDRVTGFTFMEDDRQLLFSAIKNGQSDLFGMTLRGFRIEQLTDDAWDDHSPVYVSGGSRKGIVFLSNRTEPFMNIQPLPNELTKGRTQAFFYNTTTKSNELLQLTKEEYGLVEEVIPYGPDHFAFLSDKAGIKNRYLVYFSRNAENRDTAFTIPHTFYSSDILSHNYNAASKGIAEVIASKDSFHFYFQKIDYPEKDRERNWKDNATEDYVYIKNQRDLNKERPFPFLKGTFENVRNLKHIVETGDYYHINKSENRQFHEDKELNSWKKREEKALAENKEIIFVDSTYIKIRPFTYLPNFKTFQVGVRFDYANLFTRYQSYNFQAGQYRPPILSGIIIAELFDALEDYRINAGLQLGANLSDYTAFLEYENYKRRIDWSVQLMRQENKEQYNFLIDPSSPTISLPGKINSTFLQAKGRYPFNAVQALQFEAGLRHDEMLIKADRPLGLLLPNAESYYFLSRLEFIQDNTINPAINIWKGMRFKLFGDYFLPLYTNDEIYTLPNQGDKNGAKGGFYNLGLDFRYYQGIYRNSIAAFRVASAHAFGKQKIMYQMGGVENQINGSPNLSLPPSGKNYYAFQSLATNMRGYSINSRNGNSYIVLNAELRIPIITTFTNWQTESGFFKNLQTVLFFDAGNAWEGLIPDAENLSRDYHFTWPSGQRLPSVDVKIPNSDDQGLAMAFGGGLRTKLLGYFLRVDVAYNIRKEWGFHISIGTDF